MLPKCRNFQRGPGRPRQFDSSEREAIIIDAAERLILAQGLAGASMAAIAQEAGMSKRTLYEVFESRAALFASIIRRMHNMFTRPLTRSDLEKPLAQRLHLLLTPAGEKISDALPLAILRAVITEAERQPDLVHEFLREGPYALYAMIRAELDRSVARGEIRISDTEAAARLLADMAHESVLEHLVISQPACQRQDAYKRRLDLAIRVFLGGIGTAE
ncbi:TetR/AcrR family transcriptional regulator [Hoeflea sp. G2-23]|uniref:TetR/AcrR family transcriptional regulator n=1 Tax=Hoeflea algicola TaxID=2983763 RepID=A0ABT3Z6D3_9HYPH|nr:TetR/AcrR family transcriptional regulator [Hoeflea algicola]MCY0147322.1 TetR/AcrR family transcriptional regulator [Hoeflea algicola]